MGLTHGEVAVKAEQHLAKAMMDPTPLAHRIAAKVHGDAGRWDEAMVEAERAIALDPNDPDGYNAMSILLIDLGRAAEGLDFVQEALRLDPQSNYLYRLGDAQFHLERYDEAPQPC
jgi:adenylate cyclase